ncbi:MAG: 1-acyl-sn-glycerol-3-phosphate acyltransferase [Bacteroidota bacterium]|nr:1-acyl-sn-glycerol-3-phosphate acyltransferase [Bacteroidota bacterium]
MAKPFLYIYNYFVRHRTVLFSVFISLFLITGYFASKIRPEEDISKILPKDRQTEKLNDLLQNAKFADKLVLMVSLKDSNKSSPETLAAFSDSFAEKIQSQYPDYIREIKNQVSDSLVPPLMLTLQDHLPVFLDSSDYTEMDSLILPGRLKLTLASDLRTLTSPAGMVLKGFISMDPVGISSLAFKKIRELQYDENFYLYDGHIVTKDNRYMLLFISPAYPPDNTGKNGILLRGLDDIILGMQQHSFPGVQADYFGAVAVSEGNARQLRKDSFLTLSITLIFLVLFIAWYFKKKRAPFIIMLPVLLGALFSLSIIYWIKGTISVIALAAGSIVLGIAINYSLHVYNHFRHRRNMRAVIEDLAFPLTIGGLTTIGGFLGLQFVKSEMLKDLGLFAAFSLVGAALSSLIFLPHLISTSGYAALEKKKTERSSWILRLSDYHPEKNKYVVGLIFLLTVLFAFTMGKVSFDQDMMHMNFMPEKLKKSEAVLNKINEYSLRSVYLVTDAKNLDEALKKQESLDGTITRLRQQNLIKRYSGIFHLLISDSLQKERIRRWNQYWTAEKKTQLLQRLQQAGDSLGFRRTAFTAFSGFLNRTFQPLDSASGSLIKNGFANDFIISRKNQTSLVTLLKVSPDDKSSIYKAFASDPQVTVIDRQYLASKLVNIVSSDFNQIGWMTSILVFLVLLLTYGRIELTLVSFIPMFIAFVWILGIMGLAGIQFNIVNIILSALIFGLGDDYSLFIMDGLLQEYRTGKKNLSSYKSSIVLSAITTLAGLGVLIFAKHPALRSIALVSITGILSVVIIAQVLIPFMFHFLITNRVKKKRFPWTAAGVFKSIFSLSYFALGSLIVTGCGYILIKWNFFETGKFKEGRGKKLYHRILSAYTWSVLYIMGNVKKEIVNPLKEDFSRPAVVIANHQSFLDILIMTMLYPRVVLLTNEWVWNSPLFGKLVKLAGYYPVAEGIENGIDTLAEKVRRGYSVVVFPEGTRTPDARIKRFHKGAFFLAEKLNLDILPVVIHGTAYTMSKGDFLLKDGRITIKYLPRISRQDASFGETYTDRAKSIGKYFQEQYALLKNSREHPGYFREQLRYNYLYKGPVLEWYLKIKTRIEKNYQLFHELLPKQGHFADIGCGYGFMSYLLHFAAPGRDITGYDYDEDKIATASHCFSRDENIRFVEADVSRIQVESSDGIILSDVLHYLEPEQQLNLLEKCMNSLNPGGVLLIRDGDRELDERHKGTKLTEFFSTRFFSFNKTVHPELFFLSGKTIRDLALRKQMTCRSIDPSKYTSNILFVITHSDQHEKI